jgi:hypothetical protein
MLFINNSKRMQPKIDEIDMNFVKYQLTTSSSDQNTESEFKSTFQFQIYRQSIIQNYYKN